MPLLLTSIKIILKFFDKQSSFLVIKNKAKNEITDQYSGYQLANKILKWKPKVSIEDGIKKSFDWYKNNS